MPAGRKSSDQTWETINPNVSAEAEFFEILNDFGDPLEIIREGISNAIDAHATWIKIRFDVQEIEGRNLSVISLEDDGDGMTKETLVRDFWGLGYSPSRQRRDAIGEKGHGTKIYLRSERVIIRTQSSEGAFESDCARPLAALSMRKLHEPRVRPIEKYQEHTGTEIKVFGYNNNERSRFVQDIVEDYLWWFTKVGSIEQCFDISVLANFRTHLKCLDKSDFVEIAFGHPFPPENSDINDLFKKEGTAAADLYVKRYRREGRLENHPEVTYQAIISVEGDEAKRSYNKMLGVRRRPTTGRYRVADRYGIWLCKDFIPVSRVNDWITGFGSGSNAFVLLHGFVNCQSLKLTANRGDIANTDPQILKELRSQVQKMVNDIDVELNRNGLYTLRGWQEEERTIQQEETEFNRRIKNLKNRRVARSIDLLLVEPQNESELFGLLITIYSKHTDLFEFEPLDYNTTRGIDLIARNKTTTRITEGEHWYIELKHTLKARFNHAFKYLGWIVCWRLDKNVGVGTEFQGIEEDDRRQLEPGTDANGKSVYFLHNRNRRTKIQVIVLEEFLREHLGLEFAVQR